MFRFVNTQGRQVWIKLHTVICIFELDDDAFTVQCVQSLWTMRKVDVVRLLAALESKEEEALGDDPDWWKHGRPNPLDREEEE